MCGQFCDTKYIHIVVNLHNHPYPELHLVKLNSVPIRIGYLCFLSSGKAQTTEPFSVSVRPACCCHTPGRVTGPSAPTAGANQSRGGGDGASLGYLGVPRKPSDVGSSVAGFCVAGAMEIPRDPGLCQHRVSQRGREGPLPSSFLSAPSSGKKQDG